MKRIRSYKDLRIHLIKNDLSITELGDEFGTSRQVMGHILKGERPNSLLMPAVFKRIGVDLDRYLDGVPPKRVYKWKRKPK